MIIKAVRITYINDDIVIFNNNTIFPKKIVKPILKEDIFYNYYYHVIERGYIIAIGNMEKFIDFKENGSIVQHDELFLNPPVNV